jgi:hypothetical protein
VLTSGPRVVEHLKAKELRCPARVQRSLDNTNLGHSGSSRIDDAPHGPRAAGPDLLDFLSRNSRDLDGVFP